MKVSELFETEMPRYPERNNPEYQAAAAKGGKFGKHSRVQWKTDEEFFERSKKLWKINRRLNEFTKWLVDTFKVNPHNIYISAHFAWVNAYQKWEVKLQGEKWKRDEGFAIKMMLKSIPAKWNQLLPDFELNYLTLSPEFDVNDTRTKTYNIHAHWMPRNRAEDQDFYDAVSITPTDRSEQEFIKDLHDVYVHNRLGSYIQAIHDENMSKYFADERAKLAAKDAK